MKDQVNMQAVVDDDKISMSDAGQGNDGNEVVTQYTFPLDSERKRKIAEAFQRRVSTLPGDSIKSSGW